MKQVVEMANQKETAICCGKTVLPDDKGQFPMEKQSPLDEAFWAGQFPMEQAIPLNGQALTASPFPTEGELSIGEKGRLARMRLMKQIAQKQRAFTEDESGLGTIEMVLIIVVLIALVIIFRDRIKALLETIMSQINSSATSVWS